MEITRTPFKITIADGTETEIEFENNAILRELMENPQTKLFLTVVSGTAQFSVGQDVHATDSPSYAANESLWQTVTNTSTLRVKFGGGGGVVKGSF